VALDDIGIGIRARIEGAQEADRLAQTLHKVGQAAKDVGSQRPGFSRWKQELDGMDRTIDKWHAKIQRMKKPFGKEDVKDIQKYGRIAKRTLRAVDEQHRLAYREKMRRLKEEETEAGYAERDEIRREMEGTERAQEKWERDRASYRRIIGETEEEEREVADRRVRGFGAGAKRAVRWGAGIAAAGLAVGGGIGVMDIMRRGPQLWTQWEKERVRWAQRGGGLTPAVQGIMGLGYEQERAMGLGQTWAEQAGTFRGARGAYGFARGFGVQPEQVQGMAMVQRLSGANVERLLRRVAGATEATGRSLALLPEQVKVLQQWSGVMSQSVIRISDQAAVGMPAFIASLAPELTGERQIQVLQGLQQGITQPASQGIRAFQLRAFGLGTGTSYYMAQRRRKAGLAGISKEEVKRMYEAGEITAEDYQKYGETGVTEYMQLRDILAGVSKEYGARGAAPQMAIEAVFGQIQPEVLERIRWAYERGEFTKAGYKKRIEEAEIRAPGPAISKPERRIMELEEAGRDMGKLIMPFITEAQTKVARTLGEVFEGMAEKSASKIAEAIKDAVMDPKLRGYAGAMMTLTGVAAWNLPTVIGGAGLAVSAGMQTDEYKKFVTGETPEGRIAGAAVPLLGALQIAGDLVDFIYNKIEQREAKITQEQIRLIDERLGRGEVTTPLEPVVIYGPPERDKSPPGTGPQRR
jgi:hypothetical protein